MKNRPPKWTAEAHAEDFGARYEMRMMSGVVITGECTGTRTPAQRPWCHREPEPMADAQELSQATFDRLKAEHDDLTTRGRIDIARKIEAARELGDLSENGDYHAAKEEQGKMEGRIMHLARMIENAVIVEAEGGGDAVMTGAIVTICLLYTSPSPRDKRQSRMPSSA